MAEQAQPQKLSDLGLIGDYIGGSGHDDLADTLRAEELRSQLRGAQTTAKSAGPAQAHPYMNALLGIIANAVDPEIAGAAFKQGSEARMAPAENAHLAAVKTANEYIEQREKMGANARMLLQSQPQLFEGVNGELLGELALPGTGISLDPASKARAERMTQQRKDRIGVLTEGFHAAKDQKNPQAMKFFGEKLMAETFTPEELKNIGPGLDMFYASGDVDPQWLMENFSNGVSGYQHYLDTGVHDTSLWGHPLTAEERAKYKATSVDPDKIEANQYLTILSNAVEQEKLAHPGAEPNVTAIKGQVLSLEQVAKMEKIYPATKNELTAKDLLAEANRVNNMFRITNMRTDVEGMKNPGAKAAELEKRLETNARVKEEGKKLDFWATVVQQQRILNEQYQSRYPDTPEGDRLLQQHAIYQALKVKGIAIPADLKVSAQERAQAENFNSETGRIEPKKK
jgi:hypothetical protein